VLGVERTLTSADRDLLYPSNVNPVLAKTGEGILVFGSRTLANSTFRQINVRRVFNFVKRSLNSGLQWVVFEPSDATTRGRVRAAVNVFLLRQWRNGLLKGTKATDAFYVVCDETNNPPSVELAGQLVCKIGLAIARPAEFVTFQLVQDTRAVDAELAQAGL
jgi:phage tail sheath protein FI